MCEVAATVITADDDDPLPGRFRVALERLYGERIERVVLFGSRARGDHRADSDYDIAVFLKLISDPWTERFRLADLRSELLVETGAFFDAKLFSPEEYRARTPLMFEIRKDGRDL